MNNIEPTEPGPLEIAITSLSLDKEEYGSKENIVFSLTVNASQEIETNLTLKGIKPRTYYYLNKLEKTSLEQGLNELSLNATTPSCTSGCGGVKPGEYEVKAEILVNETILAEANTTITLHS